jgi:hypothetical protein
MRTWASAVMPALALLSGCGGSDAEDFSVEIKRPAAAVYAPLTAVDVKDARMIFTGIAVDRSRPSDTEILYTIPGTADFPATIRFKLEPKDGDKVTVVHAFVHVPPVRATIDGVPKQISERKVEMALQGIVKSTKRSLEMGSSARSESAGLSMLMAGLAVATNKPMLARALDLKNNPESLMSVLLAFGAPGADERPALATGRDVPAVDPDAGEQRREWARNEAEWKQERALESAAAPATSLDRYDN